MPFEGQEPPPCKPEEPEAGACCQSGCDPCVYDLYWTAIDRYEQALAEWKSRHPLEIDVPPSTIRDE